MFATSVYYINGCFLVVREDLCDDFHIKNNGEIRKPIYM
jgi:hypothetical protein